RSDSSRFVQLVERMRRHERGVWREIRLVSPDVMQWMSIVIELRHWLESEYLLDRRQNVRGIHKAMNQSRLVPCGNRESNRAMRVEMIGARLRIVFDHEH